MHWLAPEVPADRVAALAGAAVPGQVGAAPGRGMVTACQTMLASYG